MTDAPAETAGGPIPGLTAPQRAMLLVSVLLVALCGIVYELIIATVSSYLLGDSVLQFSLTIGLFMFAMGLGSYLTRHIETRLLERFVAVELVIALVGGASSVLLFTVFPFGDWYRAVMVALIVAVGTLVGLEIPLLTRLVSESEGLRRSIANVLALDYLGALVGAVAFPLLLLPVLGLFRSSFAIGLLNALVALVNILVFAAHLPRRRAWLGAVVVLLVALVAAVTGASAILRYAESRLYADRIVHAEQTPYQRIVLTVSEPDGRVRLYLDGHLQFAESDEYRYHEALVHPVLSLHGRRERVLILGGGDGLAAREVLGYDDVERIDLVDIDPAVTRLCSTFPAIRALNEDALSDPRVTLHHEDAFAYVRAAGPRYDRVIVDLPDPHNEALAKLYSVEFYRLLARRLARDGYLVTQSSSPWLTRQTFWSVAKTIRAAGLRVRSYRIAVPSFGIWGFQLAAARGEVPDRFPIPEDRTRFLTADVMRDALRFGKDTAPVPGAVNSLFEPGLYLTYMKEVNR